MVRQLPQDRRVAVDPASRHARDADVEHRIEPRAAIGSRVPHIVLHQPARLGYILSKYIYAG